MFKKTILLIALAFPLLAFPANPEIFEGQFPNGGTIKWMCKPGTDGAVRFQLVTPLGEVYNGTLSCGASV